MSIQGLRVDCRALYPCSGTDWYILRNSKCSRAWLLPLLRSPDVLLSPSNSVSQYAVVRVALAQEVEQVIYNRERPLTGPHTGKVLYHDWLKDAGTEDRRKAGKAGREQEKSQHTGHWQQVSIKCSSTTETLVCVYRRITCLSPNDRLYEKRKFKAWK